MLDRVLSRDPDDKKHYVLPDVGEVQVAGLFKPVVTLRTPAGTWTFGGKLGLRSNVEARDETGVIAATADLSQRRIDAGGRQFRLEGGTVGLLEGRSDVELFEGDQLVARFEPVLWGRGQQRVSVAERAAKEDGLLVLFASYAAGYWAGVDSVVGAARATRR